MKRIITLILALVPAISLTAGNNNVDIIPAPKEVSIGEGRCNIAGLTFIADGRIDASSASLVEKFASELSKLTGKQSKVKFTKVGKQNGLCFCLDTTLGKEAYSIEVSPSRVLVKASAYNGFFYAIQSLKQMLPIEVYSDAVAPELDWSLPCCSIKDEPRFAYRGILLDSGRHFWSVEEVKRFLDVMSFYKQNRFHWHLTEDQGWRIEIEKYPKLTEIGAWREGTQVRREKYHDGVRYGGFYTKQELREIVQYAKERAIEVIPEVDLPGHMQAALASYPELGCANSQPQPYKVWTKWGVSRQVLNVGKESTMKFLEDVLDEVCEIFPYEYFHIGGDECPRTEWASDPDCQAKIKELGLVSDSTATAEAKLQNYVVARMQKHLAAKGKKVIGWDEILEGELAEGAMVMSWRGSKGGIKAATMGHDVIMTPNTYCYLDYCQSFDVESEPYCITIPAKAHRAITLEKLYGWDVFEGIAPEFQKHILGPQGNLWTEFIATPEYLEYMLLPRSIALSEIQWSQPQSRNYERFTTSLKEHQFKLLKSLNYNFRDKL